MRLKVSRTFDVSAERLREILEDPAYYDAAVESAGAISNAEVIDTEADETRVRFTAPTQLPRILKKYANKAPREVHWDEILRWNTDQRTAVFDVEPEVPDHWHEKYTSDGTMELISHPDGRSSVHIDLDFSLSIGLIGKAIEKLLQSEVEKLLEKRLDVIEAFA